MPTVEIVLYWYILVTVKVVQICNKVILKTIILSVWLCLKEKCFGHTPTLLFQTCYQTLLAHVLKVYDYCYCYSAGRYLTNDPCREDKPIYLISVHSLRMCVRVCVCVCVCACVYVYMVFYKVDRTEDSNLSRILFPGQGAEIITSSCCSFF